MEYIPNTRDTQNDMLKTIGLDSMDQLFSDIPGEMKLKRDLNLPEGLAEMDLDKHIRGISAMNRIPGISFLGAGAYNHYIPPTVGTIISRSEFITAYTPYQPELSQGVLQAIFEYQTMVSNLTGMDVANASLYDGSTALAEAAMMCCSITRRKEILVPATVHPEYREVVNTYCSARDIALKVLSGNDGRLDITELEEAISDNTAGVLIQHPNFFGSLEELRKIEQVVHDKKALLVVCVTDPVVLGLLKPPVEADIVVGEGQSLGMPLNFGGPNLGLMACKKRHMRKLPGRIAGKTVDSNGKEGFVLTLQAREQHIRRDTSTSNICTNQALCALAATVYMATLGKQGLKTAAEHCFHKAHYTYNRLIRLDGFTPLFKGPFFHEFALKCRNAKEVNHRLLENGITGGLDLEKYYPELKNSLLFCVTELTSKEDIKKLLEVLE